MTMTHQTADYYANVPERDLKELIVSKTDVSEEMAQRGISEAIKYNQAQVGNIYMIWEDWDKFTVIVTNDDIKDISDISLDPGTTACNQ